jgi:predicted dehydrogenase/threonine dehydrogenase-like Zn-dependent dehydrogenase
MKQVLQDLRTGATEVADVPQPALGARQLLIRSRRSLVSAGTERMLVEFGKAGWIEKARQQPDKLRMVRDKISTDGLVPTLEAVLAKLDRPIPMGYCNVGEVLAVGSAATEFAVGDRVASNGHHAEVVAVPVNLCAKVPPGVSDDQAAFTTIAAVALQGVRLAQPTLGEAVVVIGLGLIGLITVQLLRAHGCRVLGLDFDSQRLALARTFGAEVVDLASGDPPSAAHAFGRGRGVDAVVITAATDSNDPVHQAASMARKRGRIVLVGTAGLELSRADFYQKELTFQVSCSYGPGRYDPAYEERGVDYPVGFVRWTEQRNFEAVLDMIAEGKLDATPLISHRFPIAEAARAYELVSGTTPSLGILLDYPDVPPAEPANAPQTVRTAPRSARSGAPRVSVIGAGNYAASVLIPAFKDAGVELRKVACNTGASGVHAARKFGFEEATTDTEAVLADDETDVVVIATRHDSHAGLVCRALAAGKHVYVEKPLALGLDELAAVERAYRTAQGNGARIMTVGFNRRYAPHIRQIKTTLGDIRAPKALSMTVNAGAVAPDHWTQDPLAGGGRIVGEACHFVDVLRFLAGAPIEHHAITTMTADAPDTATITLTFADGSIGTIHYFANGSKSFPKERLEVFAAGKVIQLDNYRRLLGFGWPRFRPMRLWRQDKGQKAFAAAFVDAIAKGGPPPIPFEELLEVARVTLALRESAAARAPL